MKSPYFTEDHEIFRREVRKFVEKEVLPHAGTWEKEEHIPRDLWEKMGSLGFLGINFADKYGGAGLDIFYSVVLVEEMARSGLGGLTAAVSVQEYMATAHLGRVGSEELRQKYLVPSIQGKKVGALAITEPNTGSDVAAITTRAVRDGDLYVINGAKTFITNGYYGDFITLAVKTLPDAGADGVSLVVVDQGSAGLSARKLEKIGWHCSDTAELSLVDVKVPVGNLVGEENLGFYYIMESFQLERLIAAIGSCAGAQVCLGMAIRYVNERQAFGKPLARFQALRHTLADLSAELEAARQLVYYTAWLHEQGEQAIRESSMAKLVAGELANRVVDKSLQCFGGYGYMEEYPIARAYRDARAGTIAAGTSEIMREIISRIIVDEAQYEAGYDKVEKAPAAADSKPREAAPEAEETAPKTIAEVFSGLPARFRPERATGWNAVFHFDLSGPQGGKYTVVVRDGACKVENGLVGEASCAVAAADKTYLDIELGKINPQMAYMLRKVKVSNLSQMMRYLKVFRKLFRKKK